jgi:phospholipase/carboxylesterase
MDRRAFCTTLLASGAALSCGILDSVDPDPRRARLTARPSPPTGSIEPGFHALWSGPPVSFLVVPDTYVPSRPLPLVVALHGAGGTAQGPIDLLGPYAQSDEFLLLVPESDRPTWDVIQGGEYDRDIATIDRALGIAFERCAVDSAKIFLEGFSDGASYALGVGLNNPELFRKLVAFSPGFIPPTNPPSVKPAVFVSHGTQDPVLPIDQTGRAIASALQASGFVVTFAEFAGGHTVPSTVARAAVDFMLQG